MKTRKNMARIAAIIALSAIFLMVQGAEAVFPPYRYGGAGQYKEGQGNLYNTKIFLSNGTLNMQGWSSSGSIAFYGLADNWGYFGIDYVTASRTGTIHAFTTVAYDGAIRIQAVYYFFYGWARAGAWVRQVIRIYDTSNWALVTSNTYWVYSQTVQSGPPGWVNWNERVFDGTRDKYGISVDFTATVGHTYAIETFVEAQCKTDGAGVAMSSAIYNFWGPSQAYPNSKGFIKVQEISWNYL